MAEKQITGRIVNKHDTAANWEKATNFIPKQGELIVYDIDENYNYERIKMGDGKTNVNDLPFINAMLTNQVGQKTDEGGEIFNSYEATTIEAIEYTPNEAVAQFAHAEGSGTKVGSKGFTIVECQTDGTYPLYIIEADYEWYTNYGQSLVGNRYNVYFKNAYEFKGVIQEVINWDQNAGLVALKVSNFIDPSEDVDDLAVYNAGDGMICSVEHPEYGDVVRGISAHAEGRNTYAYHLGAHAEGVSTKAVGSSSHAEGYGTEAGWASHAEGYITKAHGLSSHTEGNGTKATGSRAHSEGRGTAAAGAQSHTEGNYTSALGKNAHIEGTSNEENYQSAIDYYGYTTESTDETILNNWNSRKFALAKGDNSHVEGRDSLALGTDAHAEGHQTLAQGDMSHSEGDSTRAVGHATHAEGLWAKAVGEYSHAQGYGSTAYGNFSDAGGLETRANYTGQTVRGRYNLSDEPSLFAVGNGADESSRSDAFRVTANDGIYLNTSGDSCLNAAQKYYVDEMLYSTNNFEGTDASLRNIAVSNLPDKNIPIKIVLGRKNLIPSPNVYGNTFTVSGVTINQDANGNFTLNGTVTADTSVVIYRGPIEDFYSDGKYIFRFKAAGTDKGFLGVFNIADCIMGDGSWLINNDFIEPTNWANMTIDLGQRPIKFNEVEVGFKLIAGTTFTDYKAYPSLIPSSMASERCGIIADEELKNIVVGAYSTASFAGESKISSSKPGTNNIAYLDSKGNTNMYIRAGSGEGDKRVILQAQVLSDAKQDKFMDIDTLTDDTIIFGSIKEKALCISSEKGLTVNTTGTDEAIIFESSGAAPVAANAAYFFPGNDSWESETTGFADPTTDTSAVNLRYFNEHGGGFVNRYANGDSTVFVLDGFPEDNNYIFAVRGFSITPANSGIEYNISTSSVAGDAISGYIQEGGPIILNNGYIYPNGNGDKPTTSNFADPIDDTSLATKGYVDRKLTRTARRIASNICSDNFYDYSELGDFPNLWAEMIQHKIILLIVTTPGCITETHNIILAKEQDETGATIFSGECAILNQNEEGYLVGSQWSIKVTQADGFTNPSGWSCGVTKMAVYGL